MGLNFNNATGTVVTLASGVDNVNTFSVLVWLRRIQEAGRLIWGKNSLVKYAEISGTGGNGGVMRMTVNRATTNAKAVSTTKAPLNETQAMMFTFNSTDGCKIYWRSLSGVFAEVAYDGGLTTVGAGAVADDSGGPWRFGNSAGSFNWKGYLYYCQHFSRVITDLEEMDALANLMMADPDTNFAVHFGLKEGSTDCVDLSEGARALTATNVARVDHLPLRLWPAFDIPNATLLVAVAANKLLAGATTGQATTAGELLAQRVLTGAVTGQGTVTGALLAQRVLTGAATSLSTATGVLNRAAVLAGVAAGSATTAGALVKVTRLAGATTGAAATAGVLTARRLLTGAATAAATTAAALNAQRTMAGAAAGTATTAAALNAQRTMTGATSGTAITAGSLTATRTLAGSTTGSATTAGAFTKVSPGTQNLTGATSGQSTTAGVLNAQRTFAGLASGNATTAGEAVRVAVLSGAATGIATTAGVLAKVGGPKSLTGATSGTATTTGGLFARRSLVGAAIANSDTTGVFTRKATFAGAASGTSTTTGTITRVVPFSGLASGSGTTTGTLAARRRLDGASQGAGTALGALYAHRLLSGNTSGAATTSGALSNPFSTVYGDVSGEDIANPTVLEGVDRATARVVRGFDVFLPGVRARSPIVVAATPWWEHPSVKLAAFAEDQTPGSQTVVSRIGPDGWMGESVSDTVRDPTLDLTSPARWQMGQTIGTGVNFGDVLGDVFDFAEGFTMGTEVELGSHALPGSLHQQVLINKDFPNGGGVWAYGYEDALWFYVNYDENNLNQKRDGFRWPAVLSPGQHSLVLVYSRSETNRALRGNAYLNGRRLPAPIAFVSGVQGDAVVTTGRPLTLAGYHGSGLAGPEAAASLFIASGPMDAQWNWDVAVDSYNKGWTTLP